MEKSQLETYLLVKQADYRLGRFSLPGQAARALNKAIPVNATVMPKTTVGRVRPGQGLQAKHYGELPMFGHSQALPMFGAQAGRPPAGTQPGVPVGRTPPALPGPGQSQTIDSAAALRDKLERLAAGRREAHDWHREGLNDRYQAAAAQRTSDIRNGSAGQDDQNWHVQNTRGLRNTYAQQGDPHWSSRSDAVKKLLYDRGLAANNAGEAPGWRQYWGAQKADPMGLYKSMWRTDPWKMGLGHAAGAAALGYALSPSDDEQQNQPPRY